MQEDEEEMASSELSNAGVTDAPGAGVAGSGSGSGSDKGSGSGSDSDSDKGSRALGGTPRPHGRDACVAAIVDAASLLFAERGPAAVSLREVATAANVNLGLIHRHIGSKNDLLAAVLRARPGVDEVDVDSYEDPAQLVADLATQREPRPLQLLVIVRALLDGYDLGELGVELPYLERGATLLARRLGPTDAIVRSALGAAVVLGWHTVGDAYLRLLGGGELGHAELASLLRPAIEAMIAAPATRRCDSTSGAGAAGRPARAVIAFVPDLLDRSRLLSAARTTGVELDLVRTPGELVMRVARRDGDARDATGHEPLVVVDLARPGILEALGSLAGCETIGFVSHVDRELTRAARTAGCRQVLARSAFFSRLGEIFAPA